MASSEQNISGDTYEELPPTSSDDDSDNGTLAQNVRGSTERAEHDHTLLEEEEEREKLLSGESGTKPVRQGFFSKKSGLLENVARRQKSRRSRKRRKGKTATDENGELMFEMEEGGPLTPLSDISSRASVSSTELDRLNLQEQRSSKVKFQSWPALGSPTHDSHREGANFGMRSSQSPSWSSSSS